MTVPIRILALRAGASFTLSLALAAGAQAQSMSANSASFNAGYGRVAGEENRPVDVSTRDANGNRVIVDGLILTGEDQSSFSRAWGAADAYAGVGAQGGASAIGNNLVVITQGSNNTVIVDSTQINNGNVSASTNVNSGVGNEE
ncbi:MAG: holdfast anchoring protein HfaA [Phenylobacterium sp.]|uniref:holdfast anchoring protein HfaA n=1 Tax=Phenylobacterium sp. TaxID=1871053 RepID=UPI00391DD50A